MLNNERRKCTMDICNIHEGIKDILDGLCFLDNAQQDIREGLCDIEEGLRDILSKLCPSFDSDRERRYDCDCNAHDFNGCDVNDRDFNDCDFNDCDCHEHNNRFCYD